VPVRHRVPAAVGEHGRDGRGERAQCPDHHLPAWDGVRAEYGVRVVVLARYKSFDLAEGNRFVFFQHF